LPRDDKGNAPWHALLRGYTQARKLSRQEQKLLPWFLVLRHFEYLNFQLSIRKDFGEAWLNDNYYDFNIGFLKDWIKRHRDVMY
jgi:Ser/Thr protein kinase RdoA (MazF antagonist)